MANNTLLASDNFASGSLAAGWSAIHGLSACQVVAGTPNVTEANTTSTEAGQIWTGLTWPNDHASEITLNALSNEATTAFEILVRLQAGSYSGYFIQAYQGHVYGYKITNGVGANPASGAASAAVTIAAGDIWTVQAAGPLITVYKNYNLVLQFYDTTYTSGAPGFSLYSTVNVAHARVSSWRGYSAVQQDGIWTKQGIAIAPNLTDLSAGGTGVATNSQILYEGNAQILSGTVYKMWFAGQQPSASNAGGNIYYAESLDGKTSWTRRATAVLTGYVGCSVWKNGSTYYMFAQPITGYGTAAFAVFTSSDGITWTLQNASAVGLGTSGQWDDSNIFQCGVVAILNGTWYGFYSAGGNVAAGEPYALGLITSSDGITWSKGGSNPLVTNFGWQQAFYTPDNGVTYYIWGGESEPGRAAANSYDPGVGVRYKVTNNFSTWSQRTVYLNCKEQYEIANGVVGQSYFNAVINIGGKAYAYTTSGRDGSSPYIYQIALVTGPASLAQIVTQPENANTQVATDPFTSGAGNLNGNWTTPTGGTALKIVSGPYVEPTTTSTICQAVYTGAAFNQNQYSEITLETLSGTLFQSYISPMVLASTAALTDYEAEIGSPTATADAAAKIIKRVNGTPTQIGPTQTITPVIGDVWRLEVSFGSDGFPLLLLYQNGRLILQVQDISSTPITTGNPGMAAYSSVAIADAQISNWNGGNTSVIPNYPSLGGQTGLQLAMDASLRNSGLRH